MVGNPIKDIRMLKYLSHREIVKQGEIYFTIKDCIYIHEEIKE